MMIQRFSCSIYLRKYKICLRILLSINLDMPQVAQISACGRHVPVCPAYHSSIAADDLATCEGVRASAAMALFLFARNIPVSAPEGLLILIFIKHLHKTPKLALWWHTETVYDIQCVCACVRAFVCDYLERDSISGQVEKSWQSYIINFPSVCISSHNHAAVFIILRNFCNNSFANP